MLRIKKIKDPCQFLLDSGLLFAINNQLLHPFGMAIAIKINDDDTKEFGGIWDYRSDPEGLLYDDETLKSGIEKLEKFMEEFGTDKLQQRMDSLGFIVQEPEKEKPKLKIRKKK